MRVYRVIAAVNTVTGHYDRRTVGGPLAGDTVRAWAPGPSPFAVDAENTQPLLEQIRVLGHRCRDDFQGSQCVRTRGWGRSRPAGYTVWTRQRQDGPLVGRRRRSAPCGSRCDRPPASDAG